MAFKECNCIILFLKNAVDLETELKSCIGMSKGMITSLGGRQLRNALGLLCRYRDRGNLGVLLPQSQGWEIEREKSYACFSFPFRNFNTEFLSLSIVVQQYFFLLCLPHHRLCGEIISVKCYWDDKTWLPLPLDCLCAEWTAWLHVSLTPQCALPQTQGPRGTEGDTLSETKLEVEGKPLEGVVSGLGEPLGTGGGSPSSHSRAPKMFSLPLLWKCQGPRLLTPGIPIPDPSWENGCCCFMSPASQGCCGWGILL